jgi:hypothetical protein
MLKGANSLQSMVRCQGTDQNHRSKTLPEGVVIELFPGIQQPGG